MHPFYPLSNSNLEKMNNQIYPTLYVRHPPHFEGLPSHTKPESQNSFQMCEHWPHNYGYSIPPYYHTCCNPSNYSGHCTFRPPYPQYPPPVPPMHHMQCCGHFPLYPEPYSYPYNPAHYMPQPHYSVNTPTYEYDKGVPRDYHCCGCPHHSSRMKGDRTLKIEDQEPEADKEDSQIPTAHTPYPVVWFPAEHIKDGEHQKDPSERKQVEDCKESLGDLILGQDPRNVVKEAMGSNGWFPLDMNSLKQLISSGDEKRDQYQENLTRRDSTVRELVDDKEESQNVLTPLQSSRNSGSQPNARSRWLPLDVDALRRLVQQEGEKRNKGQPTSNQTERRPAHVPGCDDVEKDRVKAQKEQSVPSSFSDSKITPSKIQHGGDGVQTETSYEKADEKITAAKSSDGEKGTLRTIPVKPREEPKDMNEATLSTEKEGSLRTIPVKPVEEEPTVKKCNERTEGNKAEKNENKQPAQTKVSKLPPVCLRLGPLPKKKNGKGSSRSPSTPTSRDELVEALKPSSSVSEQKGERGGRNLKSSAAGTKDKQRQIEETNIDRVLVSPTDIGEASGAAVKPSSFVSEQNIKGGDNSKPSSDEAEDKQSQREASVEDPKPHSSISEQNIEEGRSNSAEKKDKQSQREKTEIEGFLGNGAGKADESLSGSDCNTGDQKMMPNLVSIEETAMSSKVTEETRDGEVDEIIEDNGRSGENVSLSKESLDKAEEVVTETEKKSLSWAEAATIIQSAYRGYVMRKGEPLQKLRNIAKVRLEAAGLRSSVEAFQTGAGSLEPKQKLFLGESIMKLLFELDTIQGLHPTIRDLRKTTANELVHIQEKLDSLASEQPEQSSQKSEDLPQNSSINDQSEDSRSCIGDMKEHAGGDVNPIRTDASEAELAEVSKKGTPFEDASEAELAEVSKKGTPFEEVTQSTEPDMSKSQALVKSAEEPDISGTNEGGKMVDDLDNPCETCGHKDIPETTCEHGDERSYDQSNEEEHVVEEAKHMSCGKMDEDVNILTDLPIEVAKENEDASGCSWIFRAEDQKGEHIIHDEKYHPIETTNAEVHCEQDINAAEDKELLGKADSSLELENDGVNEEGELTSHNSVDDVVKDEHTVDDEKYHPDETSNEEVHCEQDINAAEDKELLGKADSSPELENDAVNEGELTSHNSVDDVVKEVIEASVEMNKEMVNKSLEESGADHAGHDHHSESDSVEMNKEMVNKSLEESGADHAGHDHHSESDSVEMNKEMVNKSLEESGADHAGHDHHSESDSVEMNKEMVNKSLEESGADHPGHDHHSESDCVIQKETNNDAIKIVGSGGELDSQAECEPSEQTISKVEKAEDPFTSLLGAERKAGAETNKKITEENQKLRDMLEKLIESGKKQQKMIESLSGKVKDLKGKLASEEKRKNKKASKRVRVMMPRRVRASEAAVRENLTGLV